MTPQMTPASTIKTPWYARTWFTIVMLFVFAPIGCFLLWKYRGWNVVTKAIMTAVFLIAFIDALATKQSPAPIVASTTGTKPINPTPALSTKSASVAKKSRPVSKPSKKKASVSDFYTAIDKKNASLVASILQKNPQFANTLKPVANPITPLEAAEDVRVVKVLLAHGADVNSKQGPFDQTPLHFAASGGYADIVSVLIVHGADVNATDNAGSTPLHFASYNSDVKEGSLLKAVRVLVSHGADVNAKEEGGDTPLHKAADSGHMAIAEFLVSKGADVNAANAGGETPVTVALGSNHKELADFLRRHGGHE